MSWQALISASVVCASFSILLQRNIVHQEKPNPNAYAAVFQASVASLLFVVALLHGFRLPNFGSVWLQAVSAIALFALGNVLIAYTLQRVEASIFAILMSTNSIWVVTLGITLLSEKANGLHFLGSALIISSIILLTDRKGKFQLDKGILLGLLTGLVYGVAVFEWVYVAKHTDLSSWNALSYAGPALAIALFKPSGLKQYKHVLTGRCLRKMIALAAVQTLAATALLSAYDKGNVSVISPLQQTAIPMTTVLGIVILKEDRYLAHKIAATLVCFLGVLMLVR